MGHRSLVDQLPSMVKALGLTSCVEKMEKSKREEKGGKKRVGGVGEERSNCIEKILMWCIVLLLGRPWLIWRHREKFRKILVNFALFAFCCFYCCCFGFLCVYLFLR